MSQVLRRRTIFIMPAAILAASIQGCSSNDNSSKRDSAEVLSNFLEAVNSESTEYEYLRRVRIGGNDTAQIFNYFPSIGQYINVVKSDPEALFMLVQIAHNVHQLTENATVTVTVDSTLIQIVEKNSALVPEKAILYRYGDMEDNPSQSTSTAYTLEYENNEWRVILKSASEPSTK